MVFSPFAIKHENLWAFQAAGNFCTTPRFPAFIRGISQIFHLPQSLLNPVSQKHRHINRHAHNVRIFPQILRIHQIPLQNPI